MKFNFDNLTKRIVLAEISRQLFDPLGLTLSVSVVGRLFMQLIWCHRPKVDWDDALPDEYIAKGKGGEPQVD